MADSGGSSRRTVRRTSVFNATTTVLGAVTGILIARWLGPSGRGEYAVASSWYGLTLVIFELGLAAATVYFVASNRARAQVYVRTGLALLVILGLVTAALTVVGATAFFDPGSALFVAFILVAVMVVVSFIGAPATFALQALDILRWNWVRIAQPALYLAIIGLAAASLLPSLTTVMVALLISVGVQTGFAWWLLRHRSINPGGRFDRDAGRQMLRYGLPNMASTAPNSLNGRLDQLVLIAFVPAADLGQYAVAVSLSLLATPLASAFGNVAFPAIAGGTADVSETIRHAVNGSLRLAAIGVAVVLAAAPLFTPVLYGSGYDEVPILLLILAPGAVLFMTNSVLGDLLRGMGRPGLVARAEWVGVAVTVAGLALVVPTYGVAAAAAISSVAYLAVFVLLTLAVRSTRLPFAKES